MASDRQTSAISMPAGRGTDASLNILVVDDESDLREMLTRSFSREGHRVMAVADGRAAIDRASTDHFDMLTPMVDWIENGVTPNTVVASGTNFSSTLGTLTGLPTTRSRPLCPYPQTLRYTGPHGGDISVATNYSCVGGPFYRFDDRD